ncbi:DUF4238 domain-containing protein [Microbacterium sp. X-17]|uniref:DUF4238 domain-containing protein n=1 Tax=Microbacterium sp. X-17 TaxID=3144404 RepID=UPI0031F4CCFA
MSVSAPRRQHLISKVLLRQFTSSTFGNQLRSFDLVYGSSRLRHPAGVGWRANFILHEPQAAEDKWAATESGLYAALRTAAVDPSRLTSLEQQTLRHTIALHYLRRAATSDAFARSLEKVAPIRSDSPPIPIMSSLARREVRRRADELFASDILDLYERMRSYADTASLEVFRSRVVPLLIGDAAVRSFTQTGGTGAIPFAEAATHVLPIGPHTLVGLGPTMIYEDLSDDAATQLNLQQILQAKRHVFYSPDSDLEGLIRMVRDQGNASSSDAERQT